MTLGKVPFGIKSKSSLEPADEVIFPHTTDESLAGDDLYRRSHGSYAPGEQKRRDYNWPVDPENTVFGRKAGTNALNGASANIAEVLKGSDAGNTIISKKSVEDFRNTGDVLGMSRNLGQGSGSRPFDMIYGQPSAAILKSRRVHTAAEVIKGNYNPVQQLPDHDLGKSITPGFRNFTSTDRVFGCPSIRTDLQYTRQGRRSVADAQNYGDDVAAKYLINPPPFSDLSISPDAMAKARPKEKIFHIFDQIGYNHIPLELKEVIFQEASNDGNTATINSYRYCLNIYLDAIETNQEEAWLRDRGLFSNQFE
jgi:EF-hand domain-containing family member B